MYDRIIRFVSAGSLVLLLALLASCNTSQYRDVQAEFVDAVAADNAWAVSPFGGNASQGLYSSILAQLTDEYIDKLDDRLQPNAWLLRAVSEWRLDEFGNAVSSAERGRSKLQDSQRGSRDDMMLIMLDGLIIDSELLARFRTLPEVTLADYEKEFAPDFGTALKALDDGLASSGPATPPEVRWYYHYHRWRLLQNWRSVVNSIADDDARQTAKAGAEREVGQDLRAAMNAQRDEIPDGHPLRELIRVEGGG